MTVQTLPATVDELMPQARRLVAEKGAVPSKDALMRAFRIGRPKATEIYERLIVEARWQVRQRAVQRRRAGTRKGPERRWRRVSVPVVPVPVSPGVGPARDIVFPQAVEVPEGGPVVAAVPLPEARRAVVAWPVLLLALPAFVAIWSGWVDLGRLTGFGVVHPLPGIADEVALNTAITLPVGLETYAAYALYVWLSGAVPDLARRFAKWSAIGSLALGAAGQVAYHLMVAAGMARAPWQITTVVACLPVAVLGMGAALYHLVHAKDAGR